MSLDVYLIDIEEGCVFTANLTHNLNKMAKAAGIYQHLWCPEEINITKASELINPLMDGLRMLVLNPTMFKEYNPTNGWGNYDGLMMFVLEYMKACVNNPNAIIEVSLGETHARNL